MHSERRRRAAEKGVLAGEYHSSDFEWDELKPEAERILAERRRGGLAAAPSGRGGDGDAAAGGSRDQALLRPEEQGRMWEGFHRKVNTTAKFFKERRYILQEFPQLVAEDTRHVVEFGCGNGSSVVPLLKGNPRARVTAVDFSPSAVSHTREAVRQSGLDPERCALFTCDLSRPGDKGGDGGGDNDRALARLHASQADAVLMMFMLSAVPPDLMQESIRHAFASLRPGGLVFFRDYGMYDLTQLRFDASQHVGAGQHGEVYTRGDGTLSYFFTMEDLCERFASEGFLALETDYVRVALYNRKKDFEMRRVFAHGVFQRPQE